MDRPTHALLPSGGKDCEAARPDPCRRLGGGQAGRVSRRWTRVQALSLFLITAISMAACKPSDDQLREMAYIQCKDHVRSRLISPSTASFPFLEFIATAKGKNEYIVQSKVDAQNPMGAKLRSKWVCRIIYKGGEDADPRNWNLMDLDVD